MNVCNFLPVYCPRECGHTVSRRSIVQHIISSCPAVKEQQQIKRMASLQNIKSTAPQLELLPENVLGKDKGVALIELQCQVQQLNQNVSHLIQHGLSKSTTAIYVSVITKL
jgi:siroheme synthase